MKKDAKQVEMIELSAIKADENQPRKHFSADRLGDLISSIKTHGILNPIIIEDAGGGEYILVDGERRFRAAHELKLKEVPAIIVEPQSEVQRLIQQFHLQEQHQSWSATEKAMAVVRLAEELKITVPEMARTLSLPARTISDYTAFARLVDRSTFERSEIPVSYAKTIVGVVNFVKNTWAKADMEFGKDMKKALEHAMIKNVKDGTVTRHTTLIKISDSVRANPLSILPYIKGKASLDKLFIESKGKQAYYYRKILSNSKYLTMGIREGISVGSHNFFTEDNKGARDTLKQAAQAIKTLLDKVE